MAEYALMPSGMVWKTPDNLLIPPNADNSDYQDYLQWLAAGNTATVVPDLSLADKTYTDDPFREILEF